MGNISIRKAAATRDGNRNKAYLLLAMGAFCALVYYFGELVDLAGWEALRWSFFYGVHDTQRLLFFAPIVYAGVFFGSRAVVIVTIISLATMMPRALLISPYPDPIIRPILFCLVAGIIGRLAAQVQAQAER